MKNTDNPHTHRQQFDCYIHKTCNSASFLQIFRGKYYFDLFFSSIIQMFYECCKCESLRKIYSWPSPPHLACVFSPPFLPLSSSPSCTGDQRSFIIGAPMAASLLTTPFKLQAPLLFINYAPPKSSFCHWQARTVFTTLFVSVWKLGLCALLIGCNVSRVCVCVTHLYLQLLNYLHLDSALSSAAVI